MRWGAVAGLLGVAVLATGCGESVVGAAQHAGAAVGDPAFSPCDDIPDDVLRGMGIDPESGERDIAGVKQPNWNICGWSRVEPALSVFATTYTVDDIRAKPGNVEFQPVEVNGRAALQYRMEGDVDGRSCDVAVASAGGAVIVSSSYLGGRGISGDPCTSVVERFGHIEPYIPE